MFFTIIIILTIVVVGGFILLIAFVINKSTAPETEEFIENEKQQLHDNVLKKRKKLHPIKTETFHELTDAMTFQNTQAVTYTKLSGTIYNKNRKPIVAFERIKREAQKGQLYAMTKNQTVYFYFTATETTVYFDDIFLGRFDKSGIIYNANETVIGHTKRPTKASFDVQKFKKQQDVEDKGLFPLALNNRQLATIHVAPNYTKITPAPTLENIFDDLHFGTPIIMLTVTPTVEEEKWLLAFAIFETAFYGYWRIA